MITKVTEAHEAYERSQIPFFERMKLEEDQVKRQEVVAKRIDYFSNSIALKEKAKLSIRDQLNAKYM